MASELAPSGSCGPKDYVIEAPLPESSREKQKLANILRNVMLEDSTNRQSVTDTGVAVTRYLQAAQPTSRITGTTLTFTAWEKN